MKNSGKIKLFIITFLLVAVRGFSHPHIFMETSLEINFNRSGIDGFWVEWSFDPMYSASLIADFDSNSDKKFDKDELEKIYVDAFYNLVEYNFFLYITDGGRLIRPNKVTDFSAFIKKGTVFYRFYTPFRSEGFRTEKEITIGVYDDSFYCDIVFVEKNPIKFLNNQFFYYEFELKQNEDKTIKYNNSFQTYKKKGRKYPGTANPFELNLRFRIN
ncbi:MAG: DUF1007 family protein [Spirochaetales bacterium]|nr:DUF1007 family protein [Spirochaetales bacterium]